MDIYTNDFRSPKTEGIEPWIPILSLKCADKRRKRRDVGDVE